MDLALAPKRNRGKLDADASLANDGVLPTDVLLDVLLRLPAKTLCRLRLVCRSWRRLTSDPIFVQAHTCRHPLFVGIQKGVKEIHVVDLHGNIIRRAPVPWECFDLATQLDVVCASALDGTTFVLEIGRHHHQLLTLPEFMENDQFSFPSIVGYVPSTGQYKVLRFQLHGDTNTNHGYFQPCYVITLNGGNGGRWRVAPCPAVPIDPAPENSAIVGGVAYFLMHWFYTNFSANLGPDSIASFDLALEEWKPKLLRGPLISSLLSTGDDNKRSYKKHRRYLRLTELSGSLVIVHLKRQDYSMDLWFLDDIDSCIWSKQYSLQCAHDWVHLRSLYPLVVLDDGRIVMWIGVERFVRAYDPRRSTWSTVVATEGMYITVCTYVGSLLWC